MRILQVSSARNFGGGETHVLQLVEALRRHGHEVTLAGRRNGPLKPDITFTALRLRSILKSRPFDIVHAHAGRDYSIVAASALGIRGLRVVFTRHLLYPVRPHLLYRRVNGWIAPTEQILRTLAPLKPKKSVVIPNWVDLEKFTYRPHPPHKPVTIGLAGQISPHKGHDDAVEAMRELGGGYRLLIAGTGEDSYVAGLKQKTAGLPIEFPGFVSMPEFLEKIDVLIAPSWEEPFGIVLLEAMASGTPVIGTAPRDVLHGTLIPPRDPRALAQAIRSLSANQDVREARAHVERNFDIRRIVPQIEAFYEETTGRE
jgi:glycosyltransferase involved in cell wall biosynthesis